jgi:hypothetical protein
MKHKFVGNEFLRKLLNETESTCFPMDKAAARQETT